MGIIQGATEFIPVSSSGHLIIASHLLRLHHGGHLFIQALDFGTTLALIIYFRRQLKELARQVFIEHDYRLLRNIAITCLPVGVIGFAASRFVEHSAFFASSLVIAMSLIIFGIIMVVLEKLPRLSDVANGAGSVSLRFYHHRLSPLWTQAQAGDRVFFPRQHPHHAGSTG